MKTLLLLIGAGLLLIAGCVRSPSAIRPSGVVSACKLNCLQQHARCVRACDTTCHQCLVAQRRSVRRDYQQYLHQQRLQGGEIPRELNSFRDPLQCQKMTCDCADDYHQCVQLCTGTITKHLQVAPTCS